MTRLPDGAKIDDPAFPLIQAGISYIGVTSAAGAATGTSLVCANCGTAGMQPSFVGQFVRLIGGPAGGQVREINVHALGTGTLSWTDPVTDYNGAVYQIPIGQLFIVGAVGGVPGAGGVGPSIGLWMLGICDPAMVGSTTDIYCGNLAGLPDNIFNDDFYMEVIYNDNNVGMPPEHEIRLITDYANADGHFTTDAFSADVEADDIVAIIHHSLVGPNLNLISTLVRAIFDIANASLVTTETGGTLTADGTEQTVYLNDAPATVFEPLVVQIDCTDMAAGDVTVLRSYYRIAPGGNLIKKDEITLNGAQDPDLKNIELEPNRYGIQVTLEQTAGTNRDYDWSAIYRGI